MPEGDSIFRTARALHRVLAGRAVIRFSSVLPRLTSEDDRSPVRGRVIQRVEARGKHLLIWFSGALILRTHMRMKGAWHLYRPGERWHRPRHDMRIVLETAEIHAVAFNVPVAEFIRADELATTLRDLGPDPLAGGFNAAEAVERIVTRESADIADVLLDQTVMAGIGNIYKSEILFAGRISPFAKVRELDRKDIERLVSIAAKLLRASVESSRTRRAVYGRAGQPCRRCGTAISRRAQGLHARSTYWCPRCQQRLP